MKRFLVILLVAALLVPAAALAGKEKAEKPAAPAPATGAPGMPCPMCPLGPGQGMMGMHKGMGMGAGMGAERWWRIGAMSMWVCEILKEANGILAKGNLTPDAQKQLGQALSQLCSLIPVIFYPQEMEKPEEMMQKLRDLEGLLEKIEAQARGK